MVKNDIVYHSDHFSLVYFYPVKKDKLANFIKDVSCIVVPVKDNDVVHNLDMRTQGNAKLYQNTKITLTNYFNKVTDGQLLFTHKKSGLHSIKTWQEYNHNVDLYYLPECTRKVDKIELTETMFIKKHDNTFDYINPLYQDICDNIKKELNSKLEIERELKNLKNVIAKNKDSKTQTHNQNIALPNKYNGQKI